MIWSEDTNLASFNDSYIVPVKEMMQLHMRKIWYDPDFLEGILQALKITVPQSHQGRTGITG